MVSNSYLCKSCKRSFVDSYDYSACQTNTAQKIKEYLKEGCGIRSIARLLKISVTTVKKKILSLAQRYLPL
jgi:transposase-like protein